MSDVAVQVRFRQLLADKEVRENTRFKYVEVAQRVGMTRQALHAWMNGNLRSVPLDTLAEVCLFLDCQPGDLLVLAPADGRGEAEAESA